MKKIALLLCAIVLLTALSACEYKRDYNFLHDPSKIERIELVMIGEEDFEDEIGQSTVCTIEDTDAFIADFSALDCYLIYTDPTAVEAGKTVIKIVYTGGEYELIGVGGQSRYTTEKQYNHYAGYRYFKTEDFQALLSKYLGE